MAHATVIHRAKKTQSGMMRKAAEAHAPFCAVFVMFLFLFVFVFVVCIYMMKNTYIDAGFKTHTQPHNLQS